MSPSYTVTSTTGYGSRIGNSLKWIVGWFILLIGWIILLWWNENNFVEQKAALEETESQTVETSADKIDATLNNGVVYINWETSSTDETVLRDETFWVESNDLKLIRKVEMYQWEEEEHTETEDNLGWSQTTTTTYTYNKVWKDYPIDSSKFQKSSEYVNPQWKYEEETYAKDPILLWAYTLTTAYVNMLNDEKALSLSWQNIVAISWMQQLDNLLYFWNDMSNPEIGDMKISFYTVKTWKASAVGQQVNETLRPYMTSNHRSISLLEQGDVPVYELFAHAYDANSLMTWILRWVGFLLLWIAFSMIFSIIDTLADVVPFIWNIVGAATGLVTFCLALIVWIVTVAIAWLAVRPIYGIFALVVIIAIICWMVYMKKKHPREELPAKEGKKESHEEPKKDDEPEIIEA